MEAIFLVVVLLIVAVAVMVMKKKQGKSDKHVIGKEAVVTVTIDNITGMGAVEVEGIHWGAIGVTDVIIPEQSQVRVLEVQGELLLVEKKAS